VKCCGKEIEGAHDAYNDIKANLEVLEGMTKTFELEATSKVLADATIPAEWASGTFHFQWNENDEIYISFSKHKGMLLSEMVVKERGFLDWIMSKDFPQSVKSLVLNAISGKIPKREQK